MVLEFQGASDVSSGRHRLFALKTARIALASLVTTASFFALAGCENGVGATCEITADCSGELTCCPGADSDRGTCEASSTCTAARTDAATTVDAASSAETDAASDSDAAVDSDGGTE